MFYSRAWLFGPLLLGSLITQTLPILLSGHTNSIEIPNLIPAFSLALGVALWLRSERQTPRHADHWIALILSTLFLIPSQQITWLIVLLLALWLGFNTRNNATVYRAMLIIGLAALQPLLLTYLLKWFAAPVLTIDAAIVAGLLKLTTGEGHHMGNIIYSPSGHQLLILRGCSSLTNVGSAWLVWFALSRYRGVSLNRQDLFVLTLLTFSLLSLNICRLYSMSLDLDWHQWWHSNSGQQLYQALSAGFLLLSITLGVRYVGTKTAIH